MSNELIPLSFDSREVRFINQDGELWAVGKDICEALGYANHNDAMTKHCKGVANRYPLQTAGGIQEIRIINEPDIFRLIMRSALPAAEEFERRVMEEILPSIRKTGAYATDEATKRLHAQAHLIERAGGIVAVLAEAAKSRIQDLFATNPTVTQQDICHLVELALARSQMTGEFIMAKDVGRMLIGGGENAGMCSTTIEKKVKEIRAIAETFGVPRMVRYENGKYVNSPVGREVQA